MDKSVLDYPLDSKPRPGSVVPVCPGIDWLRLPLPMSLDHINLYLLQTGQQWDLVDTGLDIPDNRLHWQQLFAGSLDAQQLNHLKWHNLLP